MSGYKAALRDWLSASHWLPALLCCLPLWLSAAPAENPAQDPLLIALNTEQGLSGGGINQLHVDHSGFLWLATDSGLNRFDASQVRRVNLTGDPQTELSITKLLEDSRQQLFVAAENQGLFQLDRETAQAVQLLALQQLETDSLPRLHDVIEQQPDQLLLAVNKAVYRLTLPGRQLEKIFEFDGGNSLMSRIRMLQKINDLLLVGTNRGLFAYDLQTHSSWPVRLQAATERGSQTVRSMTVIAGQLLLAQGSALYQLTEQQLRDAQHTPPAAAPLLQGLQINAIVPYQNQYLLATSEGLFQADLHQQHATFLWRFTQTRYDLDQDQITALVATKDGGFWLGSQRQGAYYWHPRSTLFQHLKLPATASDDALSQAPATFSPRAVLALAESPANQLIISTIQGLKRFEPDSRALSNVPYPNPLPASFSMVVGRIYPDTAEKLWLRSGNSLQLFDPRQQQLLPLPLAEPQRLNELQLNVRGHWRAADGSFWYYSDQQYYRYQPADGSLQELSALRQAEPPHRAGRFLGQLPGQPHLIVLSAADRLWLYDAKADQVRKLFEASPYQPGLDRFADKMCPDSQGHLWFSFNGLGLLQLDGNSLRLKNHLHSQHLLPGNAVHSCETDDSGQLWFALQRSLFRLDPASLQLEQFDKDNGLSGSDFSIGASLKLSNGDLVFGSNTGLTWFNPARLTEQPAPPSIAITSIDAINQVTSTSLQDLDGKKFRFAHDSLGIEVHFSSLGFRDQKKMQYRFWLEGNREIRFPLQNNPSVTFPQLEPGHYRFYVKAVAPHSGLESDTAMLELQIDPAPWYSPAALASYAVLALLLLVLWQHNRRTQKRLLAQAHLKVKTSEQRLTQALEAVHSGVWEYVVAKNSMFAQRVHQMLGYSEELNPLSMQQHLALIHPDDRDSYQQNWQRFLADPDKTFDHSYRMQHKNGFWLWFRDIGRLTETEANQPQRVIGTYSNITETRASKEKARLFGEAFQQTRDWVVLLDPKQRVLAANQSFADVFGNMDDYLSNPRNHDLGISLSRRRFYTRLLGGMLANQHWQGEEIIQSPDGQERPTLINISAVGEGEMVEFFVLVFTDITAQKQAEDDLRYLANYDALTGLPNRALLMDRILHGIESAKREKRSLALCFIDLDKFKQINDSLGHDIGDLLLKQVAKRLTSTLRLTDTVARLGGDEFVVLLESYKNDDNISHVARKMLKTIAEPMQLGGHSVSVSPSIGIAVYPEDAADATELLKHADVAMYHAKDLGRNNFQFFIQEMNEKAHMQLARETRLRSAWQRNEFLNYYQPIYDSLQRRIVGVEVLMRWQDADRLVPPNDFIPLAEDLRLIMPMTQALLVRALTDLQQWHQAGFPLYISVNLSPRHLEQQNLALETAALLAQYQLPASCLRFEVTESALMQDHHSAIATMEALSELGVQLALDDFGTGYSSLKYLKELPIDGIKIDRSFVKDIGTDRNDETIIDAMLSMASSLGMYCIAEGVESEQQLAFFSQRGCHLIQGYLFGKPMAAGDLLKLLRQP